MLGGRRGKSNDCSAPCQQSNFLFAPIFYFLAIYRRALIRRLFVVPLPGWQISRTRRCTCLSANSRKLSACCAIVASAATSRACGRVCAWEGGRERGIEAKINKKQIKSRGEKIWLGKQRERSFAQQIRTAARYKLSGCVQACACVWALMSVVMSVRLWDGAAANVIAYKWLCVRVCVF